MDVVPHQGIQILDALNAVVIQLELRQGTESIQMNDRNDVTKTQLECGDVFEGDRLTSFVRGAPSHGMHLWTRWSTAVASRSPPECRRE